MKGGGVEKELLCLLSTICTAVYNFKSFLKSVEYRSLDCGKGVLCPLFFLNRQQVRVSPLLEWGVRYHKTRYLVSPKYALYINCPNWSRTHSIKRKSVVKLAYLFNLLPLFHLRISFYFTILGGVAVARLFTMCINSDLSQATNAVSTVTNTTSLRLRFFLANLSCTALEPLFKPCSTSCARRSNDNTPSFCLFGENTLLPCYLSKKRRIGNEVVLVTVLTAFVALE